MSEPEEKRAPVQGFAAGIPWSMHLRAYDAYRKLYGEQKALIDLEGRNCRGGFSTHELDAFIPGWRDELSEINKLKSECAHLQKENQKLRGALLKIADGTAFRQDPEGTCISDEKSTARSALAGK
jgi:hypothetical protein